MFMATICCEPGLPADPQIVDRSFARLSYLNASETKQATSEEPRSIADVGCSLGRA